MIEIGRVVLKIAGRDAGSKGVVIDMLDSQFVLVDGGMRRRKCNVKHLEPTPTKIEIQRNASHADVVRALSLEEPTKKKEKKEKQPRPHRLRKTKAPKKTAEQQP